MKKKSSDSPDQIAAAMKGGDRIVLVTSGAVAAGIAELGISAKPNDLVFQQASRPRSKRSHGQVSRAIQET